MEADWTMTLLVEGETYVFKWMPVKPTGVAKSFIYHIPPHLVKVFWNNIDVTISPEGRAVKEAVRTFSIYQLRNNHPNASFEELAQYVIEKCFFGEYMGQYFSEVLSLGLLTHVLGISEKQAKSIVLELEANEVLALIEGSLIIPPPNYFEQFHYWERQTGHRLLHMSLGSKGWHCGYCKADVDDNESMISRDFPCLKNLYKAEFLNE